MTSLKIVYQDDNLMVIDKPAGLVVDPSITQTTDTLADILTNEYGIKVERGGIVHRLDKDTSGLILIAKDDSTLEKLQAQFKDRTVKKEYTALVHGFLESELEIDGPIARNPYDREKFVVVGKDTRDFKLVEGKEAKTVFKPVERRAFSVEGLVEMFSDYSKIQMKKLYVLRYPNYTLVLCKPYTGRTHQIRVHLKYSGFPLVSDEKYGGRKVTRLDKRWCPRQFLHASKIEFDHPVTGERMIFESPLSEDLEKALQNLEICDK